MIIWSGVGVVGIAAPFVLVYYLLGENYSDNNQWLVLILGAPLLVITALILDRIALFSFYKLGGAESKVVKLVQIFGKVSLSFVDRSTFFFIPLIFWSPVALILGIIFLIFDINLL